MIYITTKDQWTDKRGFAVEWMGGRLEWGIAYGFGERWRFIWRRRKRLV